MQAIRKSNIQLLTDDNDFLLHADIKDFSSIQYVTVGVGTRDFALHSVLMFITLPMYVASSIITCVNIAATAGSLATSEVIFGFAALAGLGMYASFNSYFFYRTSNQKTENALVAKVGFIEDHKSAIALMGAADKVGGSLLEELEVINKTIPKLTLSCLAYTFIINAANAIGGQFLGGYYPKQDTNNTAINVMLMSLLVNVQNIVLIFTYSYSYIKLNLEELEAFDKAYDKCRSTKQSYHKSIHMFIGQKANHLSIKDLSIYKPYIGTAHDKESFTIFSKIKLTLATNKIYKIEGLSGSGKTTFLKAIMDHWQYVEGEVLLPVDTKEDIYFIPQHSFIPPGTLIEILTYPLKSEKFLASKAMKVLLAKNFVYLSQEEREDRVISPNNINHIEGDYMPLASEEGSVSEMDNNVCHMLCSSEAYSVLINEIKKLLSCLGLDNIMEHELESRSINWNERLSGGEKQKVSVMRALLTSPSFLIMDEATSALDGLNRQTVYSIIKEYITGLDNYIIIYTDHSDYAGFADEVLKVQGKNIESAEL